MIDDELEGQLLTLRRVTATPAPPRSQIAALVERNRVRRVRARRVAVGVTAVVVATLGGFLALGLSGDQTDVTAQRGTHPSGTNVCDLAGQEPARHIPSWNLAGVSGALEARFPTCFGGIARTGPHTADLYVVNAEPVVLDLAQQLVGPGFTFTLKPSNHTQAQVKALKNRIDFDHDELHAAGVPTHSTSIQNFDGGPRVVVYIYPDTADARAELERRYGTDTMSIQPGGEVIPD
jgi:hypothetical protein